MREPLSGFQMIEEHDFKCFKFVSGTRLFTFDFGEQLKIL